MQMKIFFQKMQRPLLLLLCVVDKLRESGHPFTLLEYNTDTAIHTKPIVRSLYSFI